MKKQVFMLVLGSLWLVSCQNDAAKPAPATPATAVQPAVEAPPPAPVAQPEPSPAAQNQSSPAASETPKTQEKSGAKTPAQPAPTANKKPAQAASATPTGQPSPQDAPPVPPKKEAAPAAPKTGRMPAPRPALPADAMCFVARQTDGRVFEVRMAMVDQKKVMGDLLVSNVQTGDFVQGRLNGERREGGLYYLSWGFTGDDGIRHISQVAYQLDGEKLTERSRDPEDDGRVFRKLDCAMMK